MRALRLFIDRPLPIFESIALDDQTSHYLKTVLRARLDQKITLFNGDGRDYEAIVKVLSRQETRLEITGIREVQHESPLRTHLGIGISKGDRMDLAIQKSVELGVHRITPLFTEHCVVRLEGSKTEQRLHHWRRIAISACQQSGRNCVPEIEPPLGLLSWLPRTTGLKLFLDPKGAQTLKTVTPPQEDLAILSGPEGGFSEKEQLLASRNGFIGIRLGPRILRTETAAMAILAATQALWGDWA